VKRDPELQVIPVVVLTSSREESDVTASYNLGTNAYVVKPINFQEFVHAVAELGAFWALLNEAPPEGYRPRTGQGR
jgi:CheY-like chemotaxis protein